MSINRLPSRAQVEGKLEHLDPEDENFEKKQFAQNRIMANYNLMVQQAFEEQKQEIEMKSNLEKKKDDALNAIINNIGR